MIKNCLLSDDPRRASEGVLEPAFQIGDVVTNADHTATFVTAVNHITAGGGASSFTLTVNASTGLLPGHLVYLHNFGKRTARDAEELGSRNSIQSNAYFNGHINDVAIFDDALTSGEVSSIYNSGSPKDESSHSGLVAYYTMEAYVDNDTTLADDSANNNTITITNSTNIDSSDTP